MVTIYTLSKNLSPSPHFAIMKLVRGNWTWKSCGAIGGLLGGLSAPIFGSLFTMVSWFGDPSWHGLHLRTAGTVMFAVAIPLLAVGAHCLDLLEKEKKRRH
jgi:hypothetical protein